MRSSSVIGELAHGTSVLYRRRRAQLNTRVPPLAIAQPADQRRSRSRPAQERCPWRPVSAPLEPRLEPPPTVRAMSTARNTSAASALAGLAIPLVALAFLALARAVHGRRWRRPNKGCIGAYHWPVTPFDKAHPVRANFGDPRTRFDGPNSAQTLLAGDGTFSFHQGVDISAPDASPVYAVASGTVVRARGGRVTVECGNGRSIQYWHIEPAVRVGNRAVAGETVLGFIQAEARARPPDPSRAQPPCEPARSPGTSPPTRDRTAPKVLEIAVRQRGGRLRFVAEAVDAPALAVPGRWNGFPVTPARITWRIERNGRVVGANPRRARRPHFGAAERRRSGRPSRAGRTRTGRSSRARSSSSGPERTS